MPVPGNSLDSDQTLRYNAPVHYLHYLLRYLHGMLSSNNFNQSFQVCPKEVADRVNLGLIPSSEPGWRTACMALKSLTGGILHIHGNVNTRKGCGENINVDSHTDSSEETAANLVSGKGNDILEDGSLGENFQWDTTKAGIDCNTEPCSSDVKHCGIVENDINDLYHNKGTKEIKIDDFHKADLDHTLEEKDMTKDNISRTEGVASLGFDTDCIKTVEHSGASVANEDPKLYLTEKKEKLSEISKALFTKDGTKVQALGHESSIQSKWLLWAVGVSGKIRNILKEVHGGEWETTILHIEYVKSYAPHVDHVVLDLKCNPVKQ